MLVLYMVSSIQSAVQHHSVLGTLYMCQGSVMELMPIYINAT